jgi:hypothetical protein
MLTPQTVVDLDRGIRALRCALDFAESRRSSAGLWIKWHSVVAIPVVTTSNTTDAAKVAA